MGDVNGGCVPQTPYTKLKPFFLWDVHGDVHGGMFMGDVYSKPPTYDIETLFFMGCTLLWDVPGLCARAMCQGYVPGLCARAMCP
jgi:hypothetical protein